MRFALSILLLLALPALADVYVINVTNNITSYNAPSSAYSVPAGNTIRINAEVNDGATNLNFSAGGGHTFRMDVYSTLDKPKVRVQTRTNDTTTVTDPTVGQVRFVLLPLVAGEYEVYGVAIPVNNPTNEYPVAWHTVTVTNSPSASGGGSVSVVFTSDVVVATSGSGNVVTGITASGSTVTEHRGTVSGGGGGLASINGNTNAAQTIQGVYPVVVSNLNGTTYIGFTSLGGGIVVTPDVSTTTIVNYISATTQVYTVPITTTQLWCYVWGGGGGGGGGAIGGSGGFTYGIIPVAGGEALTLTIGQGGHRASTSTTYSVTTGAYFQAGAGAQRTNAVVSGGGGFSAISRGTNVLLAAGGGGGAGASSSPATGGPGGGLSGADGGTTAGTATGGSGGSQSAGGSTGSTAIPLAITNTAGGWMSGGNGGFTTNQLSSGSGGGGSGFPYGGGGGLTTTAAAGAGGGGGSGHVATNGVRDGLTVRGVGVTPFGTDLPFFQSGKAAGGAINTAGTDGFIVILNPVP